MREEGDRGTSNAFEDRMLCHMLKQKSGREGGTALNDFLKSLSSGPPHSQLTCNSRTGTKFSNEPV